ncbi:hypothetical protein DYB35_012564 [Aphanomyces astaci]|uniref:Uncharacterized protein n=1 Tax=Aphanomyces astaci TaxID=112090 RepID=A0A3R6WWG3_APHAT|nr:hypothetical protein DYB35_012564 [Aphanomyces astaci]
MQYVGLVLSHITAAYAIHLESAGTHGPGGRPFIRPGILSINITNVGHAQFQQAEIVTESAALKLPPSFLVQESVHQPFMPQDVPQSQPTGDPYSFRYLENTSERAEEEMAPGDT